MFLPQILGTDLPPLANQRPPSQAVSKIGGAAASSALSFMRETLEGQSAVDGKPRFIRIGPVEGDTKGYWALKASETTLLHAARAGVEVQVSPAISVEHFPIKIMCLCAKFSRWKNDRKLR